MRANQPMGLRPAAHPLLEGLVAVHSGRTYEGYWDEAYPLAAYLVPTPAMTTLLAERSALEVRLGELEAAVEAAGQAMLSEGTFAYMEYEQDVLYSSGPVMFLALRGPDGQPAAASLWGQCEMAEASEGACHCGGALCIPPCTEDCTPRESDRS